MRLNSLNVFKWSLNGHFVYFRINLSLSETADLPLSKNVSLSEKQVFMLAFLRGGVVFQFPRKLTLGSI